MIKPSFLEDSVNKRLQSERLANGKRKLLRPLPFKKILGDKHIVPKGFVTDFSSIPAFARFLFRWSKVDIAGVIHDWLYYSNRTHGHRDRFWNLFPLIGDQSPGYINRRHADAVWYCVAISGKHHARLISAWLGWVGLRLGGWVAWNRKVGMAKEHHGKIGTV